MDLVLVIGKTVINVVWHKHQHALNHDCFSTLENKMFFSDTHQWLRDHISQYHWCQRWFHCSKTVIVALGSALILSFAFRETEKISDQFQWYARFSRFNEIHVPEICPCFAFTCRISSQGWNKTNLTVCRGNLSLYRSLTANTSQLIKAVREKHTQNWKSFQ